MPPTVVAPMSAVSVAVSREAPDSPASPMACRKACAASSVVREAPASWMPVCSLSSAFERATLPNGISPVYRELAGPEYPMPLSLWTSDFRLAAKLSPIALMTPIPVTKTLLATELFRSALRDIIDHGIDVDQDLTSFFGIFDDDPILPVQQDDKFQGIYGVQPQPFAEQRLVICDVGRRGGRKVQEFYDLCFEFFFKLRAFHDS